MSRDLRIVWVVVVGTLGVISAVLQLLSAPEPYRTWSWWGIGMSLAAGFGAWSYHRWLRKTRSLPVLAGPPCECRVEAAHRDDVYWFGDLERTVYGKSDAVPREILLEWFDVNPTGFNVLRRDDGERIGHLDLLPVRPSTFEMFKSGQIIEREIRGTSLFAPEERGEIRSIYVESVIVLPRDEHSDTSAVMCLLANMVSTVDRVCDCARLDTIYAIAATKAGAQFLRHLGFEIVTSARDRKDRHDLYRSGFKELARRIHLSFGRRMEDGGRLRQLIGQGGAHGL